MHRLIFAPALFASMLVIAAPAAAQEIDWSRAPHVDIVLANFRFDPEEIRLPAGQPVVLRFRNASPNSHSFSARDFFKAADIRKEDRRSVMGGAIDFARGEMREVALVPKAGQYKVKCTHQYHETLGMTARIVVD